MRSVRPTQAPQLASGTLVPYASVVRNIADPDSERTRYRRAFHALVAASVAFVLVTFASFAFEGQGSVSRLLFWLGLAGENNVGAWWSGMLLLVTAVLAFDAAANAVSRPQARGWRSLAIALTVLSFDEIAALHEHLSNTSDVHIAVLALVIAGLCLHALANLWRAGTPQRTLGLIVAAFFLFALVPVQEVLQQTREWPNAIIYGVRGAIEEGTELAAILLLIAAAGRDRLSVATVGSPAPFAVLHDYRTAWRVTAALLWPIVVAAAYILPSPSGPADWLASGLYLAGALLAIQRMVAVPVPRLAEWCVVGWWLGASAGSNAVSLSWDPHVGGAPISLRGLFLAAILVSALFVLRPPARSTSALLVAGAVVVVVLARWRPDSQLLWCALPPLIALAISAPRIRGGESSAVPAASGTHLAVEATERIAGSRMDG